MIRQDGFNEGGRAAGSRHVDEVRDIGRTLTEKALRMRAVAYLSDVRASLLTQTIFSMKDSKHHLEEEVLHRRRMEEELRAAKETADQATMLKDRFVSLVAHDLRSPLGSISGLLQMLHEEACAEAPGEAKEILRAARDSSDRLLEMVEELLNISRLKSGKITFEKRFLDGHYLVREIIDRIGHTAKRKGVELRNKVPEGTRIYTDKMLFGEVVQNLIVNAVKFSHGGSAVEIFQPPRALGGLAVRDRGVGISEAVLRDLFKVEEKTSTVGTAGERGTGFGLPFSHDIMAAAGGRLRVESEEGEGSCFYAELPVVRPRVLVVDDQRLDRELIAMLLANLDVEVVEAAGGAEALGLLEESTFHLLISDLTMPGVDGFELLRTVRRDPVLQNMGVIVVTGDREMKSRDAAFRLGADDFLVKPLLIEDFEPRVRRFII